jgi:(1->4)-alpha-D-glucan 1-alpha-D-glucosylmutase
MRIPSATYRVQFNQDFGFRDALPLVPSLHRLGITHLYASPIFAAREGSPHGYDVIDPSRLNPALGTPEDFEQLMEALRSREMGLIVDIVPNHMAAAPQNLWWNDLLENGPSSSYASYFGINWNLVREERGEKILIPILGGPYGEILERGELQLSYQPEGFFLNYWENKLPIDPATYLLILPEDESLQAIRERVGRLPSRNTTDWEAAESRVREKDSIKEALWELCQIQPQVRAKIDQRLTDLNGQKGNAASFDELEKVIAAQAYRLSYWRSAPEKINYRRFFDIADLVGVRVEKNEVFELAHEFLLGLVREGKVEGLRVDHIDGLYDPLRYLLRLPHEQVYVVVEKILSDREELPPDWPVKGTTGYDFLGMLNALFADTVGLEKVTQTYRSLTGVSASFADVEYDRKKNVIAELFSGDISHLGEELAAVARQNRHTQDLSPVQISRALVEITACMPVYRTYIDSAEPCEHDIQHLRAAVQEARNRNPNIGEAVFTFVSDVIEHPDNQERLRFVMKWQQTTGPIMAKGVEDSTFYVHNPLVSLNEVGMVPRAVSPVEFHEFLADRHAKWPHTMNATSTHDTKRSEDVRARINVLSEMPEEWAKYAERWHRWNRSYLGDVDANEEYLLYQTLLGAWPITADRLKQYMNKAVREARLRSSWLTPSESHEAAVSAFIDKLLADERFLKSFTPLAERLAFYGAMNSLSQVLLKVCAPGLPDFYRGTLGWDYSLVDPDNRRPVGFPELTDFAGEPTELLANWKDGRIKVFLAERALGLRKAYQEVFTQGDYLPMSAKGNRSQNVFAFARHNNGTWVIACTPLSPTKLSVTTRPPIGVRAWGETALTLPEGAPEKWRNVLTGKRFSSRTGELMMARVLQQFPVALLLGREGS